MKGPELASLERNTLRTAAPKPKLGTKQGKAMEVSKWSGQRMVGVNGVSIVPGEKGRKDRKNLKGLLPPRLHSFGRTKSPETDIFLLSCTVATPKQILMGTPPELEMDFTFYASFTVTTSFTLASTSA